MSSDDEREAWAAFERFADDSQPEVARDAALADALGKAHVAGPEVHDRIATEVQKVLGRRAMQPQPAPPGARTSDERQAEITAPYVDESFRPGCVPTYKIVPPEDI